MKKLSIVLATMLVLALLCSCAKPAPEVPAQADPEPEAPAAVHVTTFPAEILSAAGDMLMVDPTDADSTFGTASSVAVRLADGLSRRHRRERPARGPGRRDPRHLHRAAHNRTRHDHARAARRAGAGGTCL